MLCETRLCALFSLKFLLIMFVYILELVPLAVNLEFTCASFEINKIEEFSFLIAFVTEKQINSINSCDTKNILYKNSIVPKAYVNLNNKEKRTMYTCTRNLIIEGKPLITNSRPFAVWLNYTRVAEKGGYPPLKLVTNINNETYYEMPEKDYSGEQHFMLIHRESGYNDPVYFQCYGTWTTSNSPYNGKYPIAVDSITLEGKKVTQYLHLYDNPRFIKKTVLTFDLLTTMSMANPAYVAMLEIIKKNFKLP
jgi:hypothetical protein